MPIVPLEQFEADLAEHLAEQAEREAYERLNVPKTLVVRFGYLKMVGEFPYSGGIKPGCGSKIVVRTHRGTEIGEMLTSTCPNSGCGKSVSRKQMLEYVENSGGKDYPFHADGRALRVASKTDMDRQAELEGLTHDWTMRARRAAVSVGLTPEAGVKVVHAEPLLGGERVTYYIASEERVDIRALHQELRPLHDCRVDVKVVGARDEARITADYERCGQYCCCKNFLKVLKPISMKSAKTQKATLDPLKISGRCGRLMCCLRYEDETYEQLRQRLPRKGARVGTPEGDGEVVDGQILTQLVLVRLDADSKQIAVPVENLSEPKNAVRVAPTLAAPSGAAARPTRAGAAGPGGPGNARQVAPKAGAAGGPVGAGGPGLGLGRGMAAADEGRRGSRRADRPAELGAEGLPGGAGRSSDGSAEPSQEGAPGAGRRRRRRRGQSGPGGTTGGTTGGATGDGIGGVETSSRIGAAPPPADAPAGAPQGAADGFSGDGGESSAGEGPTGAGGSESTGRKKRRRRRRRGPGDAPGPDSGAPPRGGPGDRDDAPASPGGAGG